MTVDPALFWFLVGLLLLVLAALFPLVRLALRQRIRLKGRPNFLTPPIPEVLITELDAVFAGTGLGPGRRSEISFIGAAGSAASISDTETWVLGAMAKSAHRIFELGTATGRTTYVLARNAPDDAIVDTLTLAPENAADYRTAHDDPDAEKWRSVALSESVYDKFYYQDTDAESKVRQHFGDSMEFDDTPYAQAMDLIFVDGSHAYSYVVSDSRKALDMVKPDGWVFWHDYSPRCPGVFRALNELAARIELVHVKGTTLVAHRRARQ